MRRGEQRLIWELEEEEFIDDLDVMAWYEEALEDDYRDDFEEGFIRGYLEA